jgi:hypothetical protein
MTLASTSSTVYRSMSGRRSGAALASIVLSLGCSGSEGSPAGGSSGSAGTGGSQAGAGAAGSSLGGAGGTATAGGTTAAGGTAGSSGLAPPFDSPLQCGKDGLAWLRIQGTLDGQAFLAEVTGTSNITYGQLSGEGVVLEWPIERDAQGVEISQLRFKKTVSLTGATLEAPAGQPFAGETLCIKSGLLGVAPDNQQPETGILFRFLIDGLARGAACDQPVAGTLDGCWFRSNSFLPF